MMLRMSALCESAHERPDGRIDLLGVFSELSAPGFPAMQERMTAVFVIEWAADESGHMPLRADLVDHAGRMILTIQGHTDVDAREPDRPPARTRLVMPLEKVPFPHPGRYHFRLLAGSDVVDGCHLFVGQLPGQPA